MSKAQQVAREILETGLGMDIGNHQTIFLSDIDQEFVTSVEVTPTRLAAAAEQFRLITGEDVDVDDLEQNLEWA